MEEPNLVGTGKGREGGSRRFIDRECQTVELDWDSIKGYHTRENQELHSLAIF